MTTTKLIHEVLDLIDRNGISRADVDPTSFFNRDPTINADQLARRIKQWTTGVSRVDRRINLNTVCIFQKCPGRVLIAMNAAHHSECHGRLEIGREQKRISHRIGPVSR